MCLHWSNILCSVTLDFSGFIQMSLEFFALHLNGSHTVPVVLWLGVLFSMLPAHLFTYVYDICCMATEEEGITRICTKWCSPVHYIYNEDRREWSLIFHRCPGEQNTRLLKLYTQYQKLHHVQTQPCKEISHCSPTRWYTVWPQSLVDENYTHTQASQVQFKSQGLWHISNSLWGWQSINGTGWEVHWWWCKKHKRDIHLDQPEKLMVTGHNKKTGHSTDLNSTSVLYWATGYRDGVISEATEKLRSTWRVLTKGGFT